MKSRSTMVKAEGTCRMASRRVVKTRRARVRNRMCRPQQRGAILEANPRDDAPETRRCDVLTGERPDIPGRENACQANTRIIREILTDECRWRTWGRTAQHTRRAAVRDE